VPVWPALRPDQRRRYHLTRHSGEGPKVERYADDAMPVAPRFQLGILLVHGIGKQPSGDTLVRWGDVLIETIGRATRSQIVATVERAGFGESGEGRAEATVHLRTGTHSERWLLSEGWWAEAFLAPSYRELVSWSVRALPWSIATHIARRYWHTASRERNSAKLFALMRALGQLLGALALAPLFVVLLGVMLVLGLLPIPQLRTLILTAQSALTATTGDSLAFVESPVRAALIRTRILDRLESLNKVCERTVIVAHSQGAAAVLDALGGIVVNARNEAPSTESEGSTVPPLPDALVTFGAGINQLVGLKVLSAGLPETMGMNPASVAVGALAATAVVFAGLYWDLHTGETGFTALWGAFLLFGVYEIAAWVIDSLIIKMDIQFKSMKRSVIRRAMGALPVAVGVFVFWCAERSGYPFNSVLLISVVFVTLHGAVLQILSVKLRDTVTKPVRKPLGLARWVDLYASADPVPNGPTVTHEDGVPESERVWNLGSMVADHTSYWANVDGFVLPVVRVCAETAQSPWKDALPPATSYVGERAAWRVGFLQLASRVTVLAWVVIGVVLYTRYQERIPLPFDLPDWLPEEAGRTVLLITLAFLGMQASTTVLRWLWSGWAREEQRMVLAHLLPVGVAWVPLIAIGMVVWAHLAGVYILAGHLDFSLSALGTFAGLEFLGLIFAAWISTFVLLRLMRPPRLPGPPDGDSAP
jgi:hypothetical protein